MARITHQPTTCGIYRPIIHSILTGTAPSYRSVPRTCSTRITAPMPTGVTSRGWGATFLHHSNSIFNMKNLKNLLLLSVASLAAISCSKDDDHPAANSVTLHFNNTFKTGTIILGDAASSDATVNTSAKGQEH